MKISYVGSKPPSAAQSRLRGQAAPLLWRYLPAVLLWLNEFRPPARPRAVPGSRPRFAEVALASQQLRLRHRKGSPPERPSWPSPVRFLAASPLVSEFLRRGLAQPPLRSPQLRSLLSAKLR